MNRRKLLKLTKWLKPIAIVAVLPNHASASSLSMAKRMRLGQESAGGCPSAGEESLFFSSYQYQNIGPGFVEITDVQISQDGSWLVTFYPSQAFPIMVLEGEEISFGRALIVPKNNPPTGGLIYVVFRDGSQLKLANPTHCGDPEPLRMADQLVISGWSDAGCPPEGATSRFDKSVIIENEGDSVVSLVSIIVDDSSVWELLTYSSSLPYLLASGGSIEIGIRQFTETTSQSLGSGVDVICSDASKLRIPFGSGC